MSDQSLPSKQRYIFQSLMVSHSKTTWHKDDTYWQMVYI